MARSNNRRLNRVFLVAYGVDGRELLRQDISYEDYYEGITPLIDNGAYRISLGVRRVTGEIFDSKGHLQQSFENKYGVSGEHVGGKAIHADGTIFEH
jgi:hypothetical protein